MDSTEEQILEGSSNILFPTVLRMLMDRIAQILDLLSSTKKAVKKLWKNRAACSNVSAVKGVNIVLLENPLSYLLRIASAWKKWMSTKMLYGKKVDIICHDCDPSSTTQVPDALRRSEGELLSIKARQKKVREALQKLNINIQEDEEPPVIAILASGGGLRAMVALLGALAELAKEDVLDTITYICSTSGSTWCMSTLYNNEKWSSCMEEMERQIGDLLLNRTWNWNKMWEKLKQTFSKENYSLTNFWAYGFIYTIINEINEKTLSNHQISCESGENPYPIYSAVEEASLNLNHQKGAWFEFTPHLAGFPAYKAFVKTELFGSQFSEGKLVKTHPEWDLCYLQGLWGSAPANNDSIKNMISGTLKKMFPSFISEGSEESFMDKVPVPSEDICVCNGCKKLRAFLSSHDLREITNTEVEMLLEDSDDVSHEFCEDVKILLNTLKCFVRWQWGTTHNFLYEWSSNIPEDLYSKKFLSLIDAGLEINNAFPLMLPPNRKVDLILSLEYSEGDPFMTVKQTEEYCQKNALPFPKIDIENAESEAPSHSCYVFEGDGKGAPDLMHFPLFNNQSCEGRVDELRKKYATRNFVYDESDIKELLDISKKDVEQNKGRILEKIQQLMCKSYV